MGRPDELQSLSKLYYRIGEVAQIVGVETHVLRYWESEFPMVRPQKSRSGQRVYSRKDVARLVRIKELLYSEGFTIAGARQRLRARDDEQPAPREGQPSSMGRLRAALLSVRAEVVGALQRLDPVSENQDSVVQRDRDAVDAPARAEPRRADQYVEAAGQAGLGAASNARKG